MAVPLSMLFLVAVAALGSLDEQLLQASESGASARVDALLKQGANPSHAGLGLISPLIHASVNGYHMIAKSLLDAGAPVNHRTVDGDTALLWAVGGPHFGTAKLLLGAGADIGARDKTGAGVFHRLAYDGRRKFEDMVTLLLAMPEGPAALAGATETKLGESPLIMACRRRKWKVAAALLASAAASANATTHTGVTATMWAANALHAATVRTLVESALHRANVDARDANGQTAHAYAEAALAACQRSKCELLPSSADAAALLAMLEPTRTLSDALPPYAWAALLLGTLGLAALALRRFAAAAVRVAPSASGAPPPKPKRS